MIGKKIESRNMDNNIVDAVVKIIQMKGSIIESMKREGNEHVGLGGGRYGKGVRA